MAPWKQSAKSLQVLFFIHVNAALLLQVANKYSNNIGECREGGAAMYFKETWGYGRGFKICDFILCKILFILDLA